MDILIFILAVRGVFLIPSLVGAGVADAVKGSKKKDPLPPNKMSDGRDFSDWYMELCEKNRKRNEQKLDEMRYNKWLFEHRQN
jgi:hypothetical protein